MLKLNILACFYMSSVKTESYKMSNLNISNSNTKISTGLDLGSQTIKTTSSSKSVNIQMTDTKKNAMLKKLGITPEQYVQLIKEYPNFPTLSPIEQNEIIDKFFAKTPTIVENK